MSPKKEELEQRVFFLGDSGKLYIGKASTKATYQPIVDVEDITSPSAIPTDRNGMPELAPSTLLFKMMRNELPVGFEKASSSREILVTDQFRIDATEVWSSPQMTGIVTTITRVAAKGSTVKVTPAQIEIYIPQLGKFHMFGADAYDLTDATISTKGYLVFTKS